jgi:hypothetical protein
MVKNNKSKNALLQFLVAIIIGVGIIYFGLMFSGKVNDYRDGEILKRKKESTCTIIKTGNMKGNYVLVSFNYNGKTYEGTDSSPSTDYLKGERYLIQFDSLHPNNFEVLLNRPVISNVKKYIEVNGVIQKVKNDSTIKYCYEFLGKQYCKFERVEAGSNYTKGATVSLLVNPDVPQNAYVKTSVLVIH